MVADSQARITVLAPKLFVVVLMLVAVIFAVAFFLLPASVVCRVRDDGRHAGRVSTNCGLLLATFIQENVLIVGILLFYVISSVPDLLRVINESMCWQAWTTHDACTSHHVDLFYYSVRVILTSVMVLMCWSFRAVALCHNLFVTLGLATFAAAMSCLWFDTWLTELMENLRHDSELRGHRHPTGTMMTHIVAMDDDAEDIYNRTTACRSHNTTIDHLLESYERFFYPCTFELALLVIHCVVRWYANSESSSSSFTRQQQATETSALLSNRSADLSSVGDEDDVSVTSAVAASDVSSVRTRRGQYSMLLIITTTLINIVYCLLMFLDVYAHLHYDDNLFSHVAIWYEMFYRALMTSILVVGLIVAVSSSSSVTSAASKRHIGVEYLVLFTSWAPIINSLLIIIAYSRGTSDWITVSVRTARILGQTIAVLHVALQTVFVFYAKNLRRHELSSSSTLTGEPCRRRSLFRAVLLVVALSDMSLWITDSFVVINMAYGYSYRCKFFYNWVPAVSFGVPVAIFYYFNCALLCLDVLLNS